MIPYENNCPLLRAASSKISFTWSIKTCFLKYYSSCSGRSIINYLSPAPEVNTFKKNAKARKIRAFQGW